jgi:hypothetical protein
MNCRGEKKLIEYAQKICNLCEYGDTSEITLAIYSLVKSGKCSEVVEVAICLVNILSTVKNVSSELLPIVSSFTTKKCKQKL